MTKDKSQKLENQTNSRLKKIEDGLMMLLEWQKGRGTIPLNLMLSIKNHISDTREAE